MRKYTPPTFDSKDLAIIRRAKDGIASHSDWHTLKRKGGAVFFKEGRWVLTLPAIDALAEWNRQHRKVATSMAGNGEVEGG